MVGWSKRAAVALAAMALITGGAVAVGASPAAAEEAKRPCIYADKTYSHGAIIVVAEGVMQICNSGEWDPYTPPSQPGEPIEPPEPIEP
jgi:hypothetical protein